MKYRRLCNVWRALRGSLTTKNYLRLSEQFFEMPIKDLNKSKLKIDLVDEKGRKILNLRKYEKIIRMIKRVNNQTHIQLINNQFVKSFIESKPQVSENLFLFLQRTRSY